MLFLPANELNIKREALGAGRIEGEKAVPPTFACCEKLSYL
jgi:hypothetical protein